MTQLTLQLAATHDHRFEEPAAHGSAGQVAIGRVSRLEKRGAELVIASNQFAPVYSRSRPMVEAAIWAESTRRE
jgi:hypothetical protein